MLPVILRKASDAQARADRTWPCVVWNKPVWGERNVAKQHLLGMDAFTEGLISNVLHVRLLG